MKRLRAKMIALAVRQSVSSVRIGLLLVLAAGLLFALTLMADGQSLRSARSLGMADSYFLLSSNCDAALMNPANLALPGRPYRSLKLLSAAGYFANNSFSLSDYNKYNGEYLSESEKRDILEKIPNDGLVFDFAAQAGAFSFSVGRLAVNLEAIGGGRGDLSKDPIEVALMGNKVGEVVSAGASGGESWAAAAVGVSYADRLGTVKGWEVAGGATVKYLRGLGLFQALEADAEAVTQTAGFDGHGWLKTISSTGGNGYAIDLGLTAQGNLTQYGLAIRNAIAKLRWSKDIDYTEYTFHFDNLTIDNADDDTLVTSDETHNHLDSYSTRPPLELEIGAARHFGRLLAAGNVRQGFRDAAFVSKTPRFAIGCEYPALNWVDLRTGVAVGGVDDLSLGLGMGLNFGPVNMDLAYATSAKLQPWDGRGAKVAFSTIIEF